MSLLLKIFLAVSLQMSNRKSVPGTAELCASPCQPETIGNTAENSKLAWDTNNKIKLSSSGPITKIIHLGGGVFPVYF